MKLDRNINPNKAGKYGLIKVRNLTKEQFGDCLTAQGLNYHAVEIPGVAIDMGSNGQFFVIRYKDQFASMALNAYAHAVMQESFRIRGNSQLPGNIGTPAEEKMKIKASELREYAMDIFHEADLAGAIKSRGECKLPD